VDYQQLLCQALLKAYEGSKFKVLQQIKIALKNKLRHMTYIWCVK
jgi:hypothetical protein